ncbi:hypothetical protein A9310_21610 [Gordonia sp. UCD-TK1]|nr:hypothetical protein A9310_21610 [Gordonia sp. UCD-TK1]
MDMLKTIEADSTQVNADDLTEEPRIVTITGVSKGNAEQPVNFELAEFPGRAYRPCKSMRRVIVQAWGPDASVYVGRQLAIYNDRRVQWGGQAVGGVRIKAMSHIEKRLTLPLTVTRGKRAPYVVEPLKVSFKPIPESFGAKVKAGGLSSEDQAKALEYLSKLGESDPAEVAELRALLEDGASDD